MLTFNRIGYYGRLGNQMFQYASLMGIAEKHNYEYGIPYNNKNQTQVLHEHGHPERLVLTDEFLLSAEDSSDTQSNYSFSERFDTNYDERVNELPDGCDLVGYFQSEKYFKHSEKEIREEFLFSPETSEKAYAKMPWHDGEIVSLHVRRTDYLNAPEHHPLPSLEYYKDSWDKIKKKNSRLLVFSDDIEWCKKNIKGKNIFYSEGNNQWVDMCMMSMCDHHIIANSSFSWWGAWLNVDTNKVVFAPKVWIGAASGKINIDDIYCEGWNIL
jgi:hypothetical protein